MASPTESSIDDMVARATVDTWGDSRDVTPPPDPEEDDAEIRVLEAQARQDLERDGCPPCYPPHLDVPVRNPPEEYEQIIGYWQSFTSTDDVVLGAQRADWEKFRHTQRSLRHRYRNKSFSIFVDEVRARRRAHGLDDNVQLLLDPQLQSRQQTWIEFQDYHLTLHEWLEKKQDKQQKRWEDFPRRLREWQEKNRDEGQKDWDDTQKKAGDTVVMQGFEHVATSNLEYAKRNLRWHEAMLCWIEQRRLAMDPQPLTPVKEGSGDQNLSSVRQRRSKRPNTPAVLGEVRVSKSTPKRQSMRTRATKAATSTPISVDSAVTTTSSTQQLPRRREVKPRRAKENELGQLLPQKVAKPTRFADTVTKSQSRTQCSGDGPIRDRAKPQRRSATQRLHLTSRIIKTRSQRISRQPVRWAPE
ncbi:MAG: hypothetical protein Q9173_001498 [Seirophora scorigena]